MSKTTALIKPVLVSILMMPVVHAEYVADADPVTPGNQPGSLYKPVTLTGTTKSEGWQKLTSSLYPGNGGYPGNALWTGTPLVSKVGPDAGASSLVKLFNGTSGGPYPGSASIYFGGSGSTPNTFGGTLAAQASGSGLVSGVKTIVFQADIGEAWTYDLHDDDEPVLTYTTSAGSFQLSPVHSSLYSRYDNGQVLMNGVWEDLYINSRAYQFNLNGISGILSISVSFDGVEHAQLYGIGLQQSDVQATSSVLPPPAP